MARRSATAERSSDAGGRRLGRAFFDRPTVSVARALLGAELRVRGADGDRVVRLVETEAYVADDPASHAYRGPTQRNRSMFHLPGTLYVYRIHQVVCANLVTRQGEAVLLRAGSPRRPVEGNPSGPGRLCRFLGIRLEDDGTDAVRSPRVRVRPRAGPSGPVWVGPRVGVSRAGRRRLRFALRDDPYVSRPRPRVPGRR
jgi:DNA-3-methyladenine glycosylase